MMVRSLLLVVALMTSPQASAQAPLHLEDAAYLLQTTAAAKAQVAIGELAVEKATDPEVKRFAEAIVEEYSDRLRRLTELGEPYGLAPLPELDPVSTWRLEGLRGLSGAAFDATFVAGEEPAIYAEEWVHIRTQRHATVPEFRAAAATFARETHRDYEEALRLTIAREPQLPPGPHPDDASMILFAMNIDLAQQALGNLALEKTKSEAIRTFAQRMIDEHTQSLATLRTLAEERGTPPLAGPGPMELMIYNQLKGLDGTTFDVAYMEGQVIFHDNWYKRIEYTGHNGKDEAVKAYGEAAHELGMDHHDAVYAIVRRNGHVGHGGPSHGNGSNGAIGH